MRSFGFDLDNTIIDYTHSAIHYAKRESIPKCNSLNDLRKQLRATDPSGSNWQVAQSWIYTEGLKFANLREGTFDFIKFLSGNNFLIYVVSHKTSHTPQTHGSLPLRDAAYSWLKEGEISEYLELDKNLFFESTRREKVIKIAELKLAFFVDDLPEVFLEPEFPKATTSFIFTEDKFESNWVTKVKTFQEIKGLIENDFREFGVR